MAPGRLRRAEIQERRIPLDSGKNPNPPGRPDTLQEETPRLRNRWKGARPLETSRQNAFPGSFRLLFEVGTVAGMSDGELLDRFLARRTIGAEAAEIAFGAIVERHGSMVLRVCRGRLGDEHDAQDAFQATFLILARKAGSIRNRDSASSWLQGVARRVASCAVRARAVRRAKERATSRPIEEPSPDSDQGELVPAIREEVGDLPEKYRTPLMLCLLDGLTHEEAATRLGWPVGTVKTRVRQAKDRLRTRLTRRGFAPTLGAITAAMTVREAQAMPLALVRSTARAALRYASGKAMTAGAASASVGTLVNLGIGSLLMSRIKIVALVMTAIGACAAGSAGYARQGPGNQEKVEPVKDEAKPELKPAEKEPKVEAKAESLVDQLDLAKVDLERLRYDANVIKNKIQTSTRLIEFYESSSKHAPDAKTIQQLKDLGANPPVDGIFEDEKKKFVDLCIRELAANKEMVRQSREAYSEINRRIRQQEQQIKELEGQIAQNGPSPTPAEQALLPEQIDSLKIDIELLDQEVRDLKSVVTSNGQNRLQLQAYQRRLNGPNPTTDGIPSTSLSGAELENAKKAAQAKIDDLELHLKTDRDKYLVKNRELSQKQAQLNQLQDRHSQALSAESKQHYEAARAEDSKRLDEAITTSMKLDMLRSELDFWKNRVFSTREANLELLRQSNNQNKPYGMNEKEFEATKRTLEQQVHEASREAGQAEDQYEKTLENLMIKERELRTLVMGLSPTAQSQYQRSQASQKPTETIRPPANVERRLSDVERKLDLILKALEARPGSK
jgi:RNA polymerase sigma factor (sigma-70 family)